METTIPANAKPIVDFESINAKRGYPFESNPWVWVITFERVGGTA